MTPSPSLPAAGEGAEGLRDTALVTRVWRCLLSDIGLYARVIQVPHGDTLLIPHGETTKVALDVAPRAYADYLVELGFDPAELRVLPHTPQVVLDEVFEELGSRSGARLCLESGSFSRR